MSQTQAKHNNTEDFAIGDVLGRAWKAFAFRPLFFLAVAAVAMVPTWVNSYWYYDLEDNILWVFGSAAIANAISTVLFAFSWYAVLKALKGEKAETGDSISFAAEWLPALILSAVTFTLACCLGVALFILPGLLAECWLCVMVEACVIERLSCAESFRRGLYLTKGCRWPLFWLTLGVTFLQVFGIEIAEGLFLRLTYDRRLSSLLAAALVYIPISGFLNVFFVALYDYLKKMKEGSTGSDDIAADIFK